MAGTMSGAGRQALPSRTANGGEKQVSFSGELEQGDDVLPAVAEVTGV